MPYSKQSVLLMGQTPPPWHGQAVATKLLFDHDWPDFDVHRLRMEYSGEMVEVGRFQWRKVWHLVELIARARQVLKEHPGCVLFYPPASARWIPFLRDVVFLSCVRHLAGSTVFIFHASGLPSFTEQGWLRRRMAGWVYRKADVALEVAQEAVPPHEVFGAKSWNWCPCAIEVPPAPTGVLRASDGRFTALFVGSLQEGKGVLEVLRTARILRDRGLGNRFRFQIVGKWFSAEFERECRALHEELDLGDTVDLTGELTGDPKWAAYYGADVFFFPTHYASEATPIVIMEALGAGLPVISTQWAGIPAMLEGCDAARILPVKSPERYAAALEEMAETAGNRTKLAAAARVFYEERFLPKQFIRRVASAFCRASGGFSAEIQARSSAPRVRMVIYLADQNPGYDRSIGITRMTESVLRSLDKVEGVTIETLSSSSSKQGSGGGVCGLVLPWDTRSKLARFVTDHFHPLLRRRGADGVIYYYPKGFLPWLHKRCHPVVVTIHDTIIQHDKDCYPNWRSRWEYAYWAWALRHTLCHADRVMTISRASKQHIENFMERHGIPRKEIVVTYEPCAYESIPQPDEVEKGDYIMHLGSREPHKRTAYLVKWWRRAADAGRKIAPLHIVGSYPLESVADVEEADSILRRPFLSDAQLRDCYRGARALVLPSEIEGFGLPALEAYYLGTPVCYVRGTSVEEVLSVATDKGAFNLEEPESLFAALEEVLSMPPEEVRACGLKLREVYASEKVADIMLKVFEEVAAKETPASSPAFGAGKA